MQVRLKCFKEWWKPFPSTSHLGLDYSVKGRTLYVGEVGGNDFYIIRRPVHVKNEEEEVGKGTSMTKGRATRLIEDIVRCLESSSLMHLGYSRWNYTEAGGQDLSAPDFSRLQDVIMGEWIERMTMDETDAFWGRHRPM